MLVRGVVVVPTTTRWTGPWLGATRATSLERVANRSIVCHVLDAMLEAGVAEVALVSPPGAVEEIAAGVASEGPPGLRVSHIMHDSGDDADRALLAVAEFVRDAPCVLHRADGLLGQPLTPCIEQLQAEEVDALLLVDPGGHDARRLRLVPRAFEELSEEFVAPAGFTGVCLLEAGSLSRLPNLGRSAQLLDFGALVEQLVRDGARAQVRAAPAWRHFEGDAGDLLVMNRTMLDRLDRDVTPQATHGNRFEGPIVIHPTACVMASVIIGPVLIGADASVTDSYVGPHTAIGERVRIEGVELERSIVMPDASVLHVGGRLVASVVGRHARVFRDFSIPRAMRLQVGEGDEVALC